MRREFNINRQDLANLILGGAFGVAFIRHAIPSLYAALIVGPIVGCGGAAVSLVILKLVPACGYGRRLAFRKKNIVYRVIAVSILFTFFIVRIEGGLGVLISIFMLVWLLLNLAVPWKHAEDPSARSNLQQSPRAYSSGAADVPTGKAQE